MRCDLSETSKTVWTQANWSNFRTSGLGMRLECGLEDDAANWPKGENSFVMSWPRAAKVNQGALLTSKGHLFGAQPGF